MPAPGWPTQASSGRALETASASAPCPPSPAPSVPDPHPPTPRASPCPASARTTHPWRPGPLAGPLRSPSLPPTATAFPFCASPGTAAGECHRLSPASLCPASPQDLVKVWALSEGEPESLRL